jgi:hypothetical protein
LRHATKQLAGQLLVEHGWPIAAAPAGHLAHITAAAVAQSEQGTWSVSIQALQSTLLRIATKELSRQA